MYRKVSVLKHYRCVGTKYRKKLLHSEVVVVDNVEYRQTNKSKRLLIYV